MSTFDSHYTLDDTDPSWQSGSFFVTLGPTLASYTDQITHTAVNNSGVVYDAIKTIVSDTEQDQLKNMNPKYMSRGKCRDTTLGGSDVINPLSQYCEYDDIPAPGLTDTYYGAKPTGRIYNTVFDDQYFILWMSFGIPVYNTLASFYPNAVNDRAAVLANQGFEYVAGEVIGTLLAAPTALLIRFPIVALEWAARIYDITDAPISRYYDFKSQMPMYYRYVNSILVRITTNLGFLDQSDDPQGRTYRGQNTSLTDGLYQQYQEWRSGDAQTPAQNVPDYIREQQMDVFQILMKRMKFTYGADVPGLTNNDTLGQTGAGTSGNSQYSIVNSIKSLYSDMFGNTSADQNSATDKQGNPIPAPNVLTNQDGTITGNVSDNRPSWTKALSDGVKIGAHPEIYLPMYYVGVRVEKGSATTESISHDYGESSVSNKLNSHIQTMRETAFSFAHGHLMNMGVVGDVLGSAFRGISGLVQGAANTLGLGGLTAIATGAGIVDIPLEWKNSTFNRDYHFQMTLEAEAGDQLTILQSIFYPLSFMLAGSLPRSTGDSSYTSPFLCKAFCKGVMSVPLGAIDRINITRGDDVHGFSVDRLPTKMVIDFTIRDISGVMSMGYDSNTNINGLLFGNNSTYTEYLDTITAMDWNQRMGTVAQIRRFRILLNSLPLVNRRNDLLTGMSLGSSKIFRFFNAVTGITSAKPSSLSSAPLPPQ